LPRTIDDGVLSQEYNTANVATALLDRVSRRDPSRVVPVGDRMSYLVIESAEKKKRDMCEEVREVVTRGLNVNLDYVLDNTVRNTMFKFLAIAGVDDAGAFVESCKRPEGGRGVLPKRTSVKQLRGAPAVFGGLYTGFRSSVRDADRVPRRSQTAARRQLPPLQAAGPGGRVRGVRGGRAGRRGAPRPPRARGAFLGLLHILRF
jgi:hypothetical protein